MQNFSVIITAGGTSSRYGKTNKLLEKINGKTVIEHTVSKFINFENVKQIIIPSNISIINELKQIFNQPKISIVEGGASRQESVYKALNFVNENYVLIHDGARPLITERVINNCFDIVL